MESSEIFKKAEEQILKWIESLKAAGNLANDIENQVTELENECNAKKSYLQALTEDFNYDRNDLRTFANIQRDYKSEIYIKELENTLEIVMGKYREHTQHKIESTKLDFDKMYEKLNECDCMKTVNKLNGIINGLGNMLDDFLNEGQEVTNKLIKENFMLRAEIRALRDIANVNKELETKDINNNE